MTQNVKTGKTNLTYKLVHVTVDLFLHILQILSRAAVESSKELIDQN